MNLRSFAFFAFALFLAACSDASSDVDAQDANTASSATTFATENNAPGSGDDRRTERRFEDVGSSDPTPECADGDDCTDGDSCTKNDQCLAGACQGSAIDCSDGIPCTTDSCEGGLCANGILEGHCLIDGDCWNEGDPNPTRSDGCSRCEPQFNVLSWSSSTGFLCDDGDDCTESDSCQAGICTGTPLECNVDDGNPCTEPGCEQGGCVQAPLNDVPCGDVGAPCASVGTCQNGTCLGASEVDCDDGLSCTVDLCAGTQCENGVMDGYCLIAGECIVDGAPSPANMCHICDASTDSTAWTLVTEGDGCSASTCDDGEMNGDETDVDCGGACEPCDTAPTCDDGEMNGDETGVDCGGTCVACTGGEDGAVACTYHTDCYPEGVCAKWFTTGLTVCSVPCAGNEDCETDQICSKLPGSLQVGYCEEGAPGGAVAETPCIDPLTCESTICVNGACANTCMDEAACPGFLQTCQLVGVLDIGFVGGICLPNGTLLGESQICQTGQVYDSSFCASGHCDLLASTAMGYKCSPLCKTHADCGFSGKKCGIIFHAGPPLGTTPNPDYLPYDPQFIEPTYDAVSGCYTPLYGLGGISDGSVCNLNTDCQTGHCLHLNPAPDDTRYCTRQCIKDDDCVMGMQCKLTVANLVSDWLEAAGTYNAGVYTLTRICKFP